VIFESVLLVSIGLMVGLSGAVIPGPLLAFTLYDTSRKRRVTGHYIMMGHVLWEFGVILLILFGFGWIILGNSQIIYLAGGLVLAVMGIRMIHSRTGEAKMEARGSTPRSREEYSIQRSIRRSLSGGPQLASLFSSKAWRLWAS